MKQGNVERAAQQAQNVREVAPPAQLQPNGPGLAKNELHHLAQRGRERGRAPGEAHPGALQATSFLFRGGRRGLAVAFGIEIFLKLRGRDRPVRKKIIGQHTNRPGAEHAKKAEDAFQRRQAVAIAMTQVMTVVMNFVMGINRAARAIPCKVGRTNLHTL